MPDLELSRRQLLQAAMAGTTVLVVQPCGGARAASRRLSLAALQAEGVEVSFDRKKSKRRLRSGVAPPLS
jgi:hypothetical protein